MIGARNSVRDSASQWALSITKSWIQDVWILSQAFYLLRYPIIPARLICGFRDQPDTVLPTGELLENPNSINVT